MSKKERKILEQQLELSIAYFLKKQDEKVASEMTKPIRYAAKELAKKFLRHLEKVKAPKPKATEPAKKEAVMASPAAKAPAKKSVKTVKKSPAKAAKKK